MMNDPPAIGAQKRLLLERSYEWKTRWQPYLVEIEKAVGKLPLPKSVCEDPAVWIDYFLHGGPHYYPGESIDYLSLSFEQAQKLLFFAFMFAVNQEHNPMESGMIIALMDRLGLRRGPLREYIT